MKQAFVILIVFTCVALFCACNSTEHGKLHHVVIYVIKDDSTVADITSGYSVVKFDEKNRVIDSVFYYSLLVSIDANALEKAMAGIPKETPIEIRLYDADGSILNKLNQQ